MENCKIVIYNNIIIKKFVNVFLQEVEWMFDLSKNYEISRKIAAEGMVLLKNEARTLPLENQKVGIIGKECLDLIRGGGGSAAVKCAYVKSLLDGLREKANENKISLCEESFEVANSAENYTLEQLNSISGKIDTAIVTFKRYGSEGADRRLGKSVSDYDEKSYNGEANDYILDDYEKQVGYFYPSESEIDLLRKIEKSDIKSIVLILNISSSVDISFIEKFTKIKAVLLTYLPGMEAGRAIADVLCGDVNPSGKLVDTIAYRYEDYPSSDSFDIDPKEAEYKEDIFVGYRYFETYSPEKVMFPFGFGLSYTKFEFLNCTYMAENNVIQVSVDVKNVGNFAGKEVVQVYSSAPRGLLKKPSIELKGFAKTKLLSPGESENITISFEIDSMASFDTDGVCGHKAAWILEKGDYVIKVGNSVRNTQVCGVYTVPENTVTQQLTLRFNGSEYPCTVNSLFQGETKNKEMISLYDVYEGKTDIHDFIKQLSPKELISLAQGQPPAFPLGTAGVGNLKKYGVPNSQTADGPAGIRRSVNTTCFPCGTLIACTWDKDLQFKMGKALGIEGVSTGIDIILAPSVNIHRNPLCGRNFEYLSEDPLVTGKTAASLINGIQSEGLCATIKHFAANNREKNRHTGNSIVSERALREIYLKGFEIAVKESNPAFVMSAYNMINGKYVSANAQLLKGILRDEWGYEGAVMTDWRNKVNLDDEIRAGNNIKMPFGYPDHAEKALECYNNGKLSIEELRENAFYVMNAVMKTNSFFKRNFGKKHFLKKEKTVISAIDVNGLSSTRIKQDKRSDNVGYLYNLNLDQRAQRTFVYYVIDAPENGDYLISAEISTNCPQTQIWYYNENNDKTGIAFCDVAVDENKWYSVDTKISLHKGENTLKLVFAAEPENEYEYFDGWSELPKEDIKLARIIISKKK